MNTNVKLCILNTATLSAYLWQANKNSVQQSEGDSLIQYLYGNRPLANTVWRAAFFYALAAPGKKAAKMTNTLPTVDMKATGIQINTLRKRAGLSVKDIQANLGLGSTQAIYKWMAGQSLPSIDNLVILSALFHVSLDDIIVRT